MPPTLRPRTPRARLALCFALVAPCLTACAGDEDFHANVAGAYMISITNAASSCSFDWTEGEMTAGIPFTITQDGLNVTGEVGGVAGVFFSLWLGTTTFTGTVSGNDLSMVAHGVNPQVSGNCTYTFDATVAGRSTGDSLDGTITYSPRTNGNPDCAAVQCAAEQRFAGSRPPP